LIGWARARLRCFARRGSRKPFAKYAVRPPPHPSRLQTTLVKKALTDTSLLHLLRLLEQGTDMFRMLPEAYTYRDLVAKLTLIP